MKDAAQLWGCLLSLIAIALIVWLLLHLSTLASWLDRLFR